MKRAKLNSSILRDVAQDYLCNTVNDTPKPSACGSACGTKDAKSSPCGSACGTKDPRTSPCGSACGIK
ncbi:MAG: hypothetical protein IJ748_02930 [Bacteroidales bacterium]|nr:hypothetical protein [Bacteroidales bacterium]